MDLFNYFWDDQVKSPYLLGNSLNTFVTYDDEISIAAKTAYANQNNARGVIIWELTGDYLETLEGSGIISQTPLIDIVNNVFNEVTTGENIGLISDNFKLIQNFPNPFNPSTTIGYQLKTSSEVELGVYNIKGQKLIILVSDYQAEGHHEVIWNRQDICGNPVSSGIYFYKLTVGVESKTRKMIMMK